MTSIENSKPAANLESLNEFRALLQKKEWAGKNTEQLNDIFDCLSSLVHGYAVFYQNAGARHSKTSEFTRSLTWLFGSAGVILPLVASTDTDFAFISNWGYPLLAVAAASHAYNRMFGSTKGHVRYTIAKHALNKLLSDAQLEWSFWRISNDDDSLSAEKVNEAHALFKKWLDDAYLIVQNETAAWAIAIVDDMEAVNNQLSAKQTHTATTSDKTPPSLKPGHPTVGGN